MCCTALLISWFMNRKDCPGFIPFINFCCCGWKSWSNTETILNKIPCLSCSFKNGIEKWRRVCYFRCYKKFQFYSFTFLKGDICDIGDICNMMEGQGEVFFKCKMCYFTKSVTSAAVDTKLAAEGINLAGAWPGRDSVTPWLRDSVTLA